MNNSYMHKVAEMFGLELGEKFDIENCSHNPYKFTEDGLFDYLGTSRSTVLEQLLNGTVAIIKKPWKPKEGEIYYYIDANRGKAYNAVWNDHPKIVGNYLIGNVFRTEEEAVKNIEAYCKYIEAKEPDLSWRNNE